MAVWTAAAYAALVVIGTTNREMTGVLLVISFFALKPRQWRLGLVYAALFAGTYGALRLAIPVESVNYIDYIQHVWGLNTGKWFETALLYNVLLLPLWVMAAANWRGVDARLRRLTYGVLVVYLPLWFTQAIWQEVRLLMVPLILLVPVIVRTADSVRDGDSTAQ